MLNTKQHKTAKLKGYQDRLDGKSITDNYYSPLGKVGQVYSSIWDKGWREADDNLKKEKP